MIELGEALYSYCPNFPNASITLPPGGAHRISKPWLLGGTYRCKTRRALAAHPSPHDIYVTGTVSRELWPAGCGPSNFLTDRIVALPPRAAMAVAAVGVAAATSVATTVAVAAAMAAAVAAAVTAVAYGHWANPSP